MTISLNTVSGTLSCAGLSLFPSLRLFLPEASSPAFLSAPGSETAGGGTWLASSADEAGFPDCTINRLPAPAGGGVRVTAPLGLGPVLFCFGVDFFDWSESSAAETGHTQSKPTRRNEKDLIFIFILRDR